MATDVSHHTLVIGAGFGGLRCVMELEKRFRRLKDSQVTVIDKQLGHVYTPLLYEVATGVADGSEGGPLKALEAGVFLPFDTYARHLESRRVTFVQGAVVDIDTTQKIVRLQDGSTLSFDSLVLSIGAQTATYGVSGVESHAHFLKTLQDALNIREDLMEMIDEMSDEKRHVVVVGGGATGTEFAAELANYVSGLKDVDSSEQGVEIHLIEAGESILSDFDKSVQAYAKKRLQKLGVTIHANTRVTSVGANLVEVEDDGEATTLPQDLVVWTAGLRSHDLPTRAGLPVDEDGFVCVEPTLQVKNTPDLFAIGDCARVVDPKTGQRVPALGQAATAQGAVVAENIARSTERRSLVRWQPPGHWKTVVPLGGKYAVADLGRFYVKGRFGYALRKVADLLYFLSALRVRDAVRVWIRGARAFIRND